VYHAVTTYATKEAKAAVHVVATAAHGVARAATATVHFVKEHAATIASVAASVVVMAGCEATLGAATAGAATPVCGALAGAAGSAAGYAVTAAQTGKFSWTGLGEAAGTGALAGLVGDGIGEAASGLAGSLLASGGDAVESALAGGAVDSAEAAEGGSAAAADEAAGAAGGDPGAGGGGGEGDESPGSCPTAGGQSFTAGTLVLLASGKTVPISALKVGDTVLAADTKTGKNQTETVTAVLVHHDTDLYDLRVESGGRTEVIHTTSNHLFWDPYPHYGWIPANHLKPGEKLKTPDGQSAVVVGGSVPADHDGWMWDLTVPGNNDHDFYVAAGTVTGILVHNTDGPCEVGPGGTPSFYRGARPGEEPSFAPRPNEYRVDPSTGTVRSTHGVSLFDNPGSVSSKGFVPYEVDQSTIPDELRIIQRGADPSHYEIVPQQGTSLTPQQFTDLLCQISCRVGN
jgi:hypothetical protein